MYDTTSKHAFLVTAATPNTWALVEAIPSRTESGPDNLSLIYEGFFPSLLTGAAPSLSAWQRGATPVGPSGTWRVTGATPSRLYGPFWRLEVAAKGMVDSQQRKLRWITGSSTFLAEDVTVPGSGVEPRVSGRLPEVGLEASYLSVGNPPGLASGVVANPYSPSPPTPANPWSSIADSAAVVHYPSGWVREAVDSDMIVPGLWWTTERFVYTFQITG